MPNNNFPTYLGDGVYAVYDGWMIGLALGTHDNLPLIWLEPEVLQALVKYAKARGMLVE